jgi:hypothetical protein
MITSKNQERRIGCCKRSGSFLSTLGKSCPRIKIFALQAIIKKIGDCKECDFQAR